jgi:hypothetical protein
VQGLQSDDTSAGQFHGSVPGSVMQQVRDEACEQEAGGAVKALMLALQPLFSVPLRSNFLLPNGFLIGCTWR